MTFCQTNVQLVQEAKFLLICKIMRTLSQNCRTYLYIVNRGMLYMHYLSLSLLWLVDWVTASFLNLGLQLYDKSCLRVDELILVLHSLWASVLSECFNYWDLRKINHAVLCVCLLLTFVSNLLSVSHWLIRRCDWVRLKALLPGILSLSVANSMA